MKEIVATKKGDYKGSFTMIEIKVEKKAVKKKIERMSNSLASV